MAKTKRKIKSKIPSNIQAITWNNRLGSNEYKHRRMTFGKYTNWFIKDLPTDYLKWSILNLNVPVNEYLARELQRRETWLK
jgi:hypothetical protein